MNYNEQIYRYGDTDIPLKLIKRRYGICKAKRYLINDTNQNVWIPNYSLDDEGNIIKNINFIFNNMNNRNKVRIAGIKLK